MEKTFNQYKNGEIIKEDFIKEYPQDYKKESRMIKMGMLINVDEYFVINPLVQKCNSFNSAKNRIKKTAERWILTIQEEQADQDRFRYQMVEYFKMCDPIEVYNKEVDFTNVEYKYRKGAGLAYIREGMLIAFHYGFTSPSNAPKDCDIFKAETELDTLILEG